MKSVAVIVAFLAASVVAQGSGPAIPPGCVLGCLTKDNLGDCNPLGTDNCVCTPEIQAKLGACAQKACTGDDLEKAKGLQASQCPGTGAGGSETSAPAEAAPPAETSTAAAEEGAAPAETSAPAEEAAPTESAPAAEETPAVEEGAPASNETASATEAPTSTESEPAASGPAEGSASRFAVAGGAVFAAVLALAL